MFSVCQHLVPRMLTPEQKLTQTNFSVDPIDIADRDNKLLNNIIKGIKHSFYHTIQTQNDNILKGNRHRHLEAKISSRWEEKKKSYAGRFLEREGIVHYKFISDGTVVNK